ncbi:MAG: endonuclease domain-containing protein [Actinomycetes bacterium]
MKSSLLDLFERETVVIAQRFPTLRNQLGRAFERGEAARVLPGVFALAEMAGRLDVRALAVCRRFPGAVLLAETAAVLTYAPTRDHPRLVHVAQKSVRQQGFVLERREIPEPFVGTAAGLRFTLPAWTALDLALTHGSGAIDEALREGVKLDDLEMALTHHSPRRGTARLRGWLVEASERPWSPAERQGHQALRDAGITGWRGNVAVRLPNRLAYVDVGFEDITLGIEIDGYEHHGTRRAFVGDRMRDAELGTLGWQIHRLPASLVLDEPALFVELVAQLVARRKALLDAIGGR